MGKTNGKMHFVIMHHWNAIQNQIRFVAEGHTFAIFFVQMFSKFIGPKQPGVLPQRFQNS